MLARNIIRIAVYGFLLLFVQTFCHAQPAAARKPSARAAATPAPRPASRIVDTAGKPLAGVKVYVQQRPWFPLAEEVVESTPTLSGANGEYQVPQDAPPDSLIVFAKEGYATRAFTAGDDLPEQLMLQPGEGISGSVVDEKGTSLSGALIGPVMMQGRLTQESGRRVPLLFTKTDTRGNFALSGLTKGRYDVLVQSPDKIARLVAIFTGVEKKVLLESGGTTVTGTVKGTRDQHPKPHVYVEALSPGMKLYSKTDEYGRFAFSSLAPREWRFRVAGDSNAFNHPTVTLQVQASPVGYDVELLMTQGIAIAGQVLDAETSAPIADMELRLDTDPPRTVRSDAGGNFVFDRIETFTDLSLRFDTTRYSYEENGQAVDYYVIPSSAGVDVTTVTLPLRPRVMLSGKVTDTIGRGVASAQITARSLSGGTVRIGKKLQGVQFSARSRPNGEFAIGVSPPGRYEVWASTSEFVAKPEEADVYSTTTANVTLVLSKAIEAAGRVVDANDQPVTAAIVQVFRAGENESQNPTPLKSTNSDMKAEFTFPGLPASKFTFVATHPHFVESAQSTVELDATGSSSIVLKFPGGSDLQLQVVDKATRRPMQEAEVKVLFTGTGDQKVVSKETDEAGYAAFRALPQSKVDRISVDVEGYNIYEQNDVSVSPQVLVVELSRRSTIEVKVEEPGVTADTMVGDLTVYLLAAEEKTAQAPAADAFNVRDQKAAEQGKAKFSDMSPGWYKVAARRGSTFVDGEAFQLAESQNVEQTVVLQPGGAIRGRVVDKKTRQPVAEAAVKIDAAVVGIPEAGGQSALSAADGTFTISGAPAGDVSVTVIHEKYPEHKQSFRVQSSQPQDVVIELSSELATISGSVTYGGAPLQDALVVIYKGKTESPLAQATTDASGNYVLQNVPPGQHLVTVEAPIGETGSAGHKNTTVNVEGATATANFAFQKLTTVIGRVRLRGGAPSAESSVLFIPKEAGVQSMTVSVGADGTYKTELEPATYTASLDDRPGKEVRVPPSDREYRIDLNF